MADEKKSAKAPKVKAVKPKSPAKPKVAKAKPTSAPKKTSIARPQAKVAKVNLATEAKKSVRPIRKPKGKKTRSYTRKAQGAFADLLKKQAELEEIKKHAKAELKKQYESSLQEADNIKAQYKELFNEGIESAPKVQGERTKKSTGKVVGLKPFSLKEVEDFIAQKKAGGNIKIPGRRPKSIARMEAAYKQSEEAEEILKILSK